jgi:hypothetical protein
VELRVRFGVPLTKPLPPDRYSDVWEAVDAHLFGGRLDANARAIS